jgi:hypothetical protein
MQHLRRLVHFASDAVSTIFPYDRIAVSPCVPLDGMPDIAQSRAWTNGPDAFPHRLIRDFHESFS